MKNNSTIKTFGKRLSSIRKERGITQRQLAELVGVSERVIAYYEVETKYPPAHLIAPLSKALKISSDEFLGIKDLKQQLNPENAALWRRLKKVESLPKRDQKALFQILDALLKKNNGKGNK